MRLMDQVAGIRPFEGQRQAKKVNFGNATSAPGAAAPGLTEPAAPVSQSAMPKVSPDLLQVQFGMARPAAAPKFAAAGNAFLDELTGMFDVEGALSYDVNVPVTQFLADVMENPRLVRSTVQRINDMILDAEGPDRKPEMTEVFGKPVRRWQFFTSPPNPKDSLVGLEEPLDEIVSHIREAALGTDAKKRALILVGSRGSAKSTIARIFRTSYEKYSATPQGALHSVRFVDIPEAVQQEMKKVVGEEFTEQVVINPVYLLPEDARRKLQQKLNETYRPELGYDLDLTDGKLPPASQKLFDALLRHEAKEENGGPQGAYQRVLDKYARVYRVQVSETNKVGIATHKAGEPKSQDETDLTGSPDLIKSLKTGFSNPLGFNFRDGEFFAANGGILELEEVFKWNEDMLKPLLGLAEERSAKGKKMPSVFVDTFVIGHTNWPEYDEKKSDPTNEAMLSRMKLVRIPFNLTVNHERAIHERIIGRQAAAEGVHIAPHALRTTALWAVLSRLVKADDQAIDLLTKALLYNGEKPTAIGEAKIRDMIDAGVELKEGHHGVSVRDIQQVLPTILSHPELQEDRSVDGFILLALIEDKLRSGQLDFDKKTRDEFIKLLSVAKKDLTERVSADVRRAVAGDRDLLNNLFNNYVDNVIAFNRRDNVRSALHGHRAPDEEFMRSIEAKLSPPIVSRGNEPSTDAKLHRQKVAAQLGVMKATSGKVDIDSDPVLREAIVKYQMEQTKNQVPVEALLSTRKLSESDQRYRDRILDNLKEMGYNDTTARRALAIYASPSNR